MKLNKTTKKVFEGTIGSSKYLFDAKSGKEIARIAPNETRSQAAAKRRLELIPRKQADKNAVRALIRAWIAARRPSMKTIDKKRKTKMTKTASKQHAAA